MKKSIIFDMDGLMIDSERVTFQGYHKILEEYGYKIDAAYYKTWIGSNMDSVIQKMYEHYGRDIPAKEITERVYLYIEKYFSDNGIPIKSGLRELLDYCEKREFKMALATSSNRDRVEHILKKSNLEKYFSDYVCGNEVNKGKPDPEIFLVALKKVGVSPSEAIVVEDSEQGIEASYRAGISCLCVPDMVYPRKKYIDMTDYIGGTLLDVRAYLSSRYGACKCIGD